MPAASLSAPSLRSDTVRLWRRFGVSLLCPLESISDSVFAGWVSAERKCATAPHGHWWHHPFQVLGIMEYSVPGGRGGRGGGQSRFQTPLLSAWSPSSNRPEEHLYTSSTINQALRFCSMGSLSASKRAITASDISTLQSLLSSTTAALLTPQEPAYPASVRRWSRAAEKPAGLVLVPSNAEEISIAVKYAAEQGIDVAVKGGGHSTAGVSSTTGGLLIDLNSKMRRVDVDVNKKLFVVQGGCTWGDVDQAGVPHGLATVGGTVTDTGVGGLTLGGGYGHLSGTKGLTIDCLVECTVVLANGDVTKASREQNADLFWALQGAGQNFGVVIEFVFNAFEQGNVWAGLLIFPPTPDNIHKVVAACNDIYMPDQSGKTKVAGHGAGGIAIARPPPAAGQVVLLVPIVYFGTEQEAKDVYKALYGLGPVMDTTAYVPYPTINTLLAPPIGLRASMKGASYELPVRPGFVEEVLAEYNTFTAGNDDTANSLIYWEMYDPAKVVASETGSFANRGWHLNAMICPLWTAEANDASCRQWARHLNEAFKKELEAQGKETGHGVDGGVGVRGKKGAVLLYGNYDRECLRSRAMNDIVADSHPLW